jgi:pimeloyl-ACP methyl ester carboxylesterase
MSATAFLARFVRPAPRPAEEREMLFDAGGECREATVYLPRRHGRAPAWILLHGVTVAGRHHEAVRRMARGLAGAGHLAFVPEVPRWRSLAVTPEDTDPTVTAALSALRQREDVEPGRVGLMGFSVAGTWAVGAAASRADVRAVVAFGGYADFGATFRAMMTGDHEWEGRRYRYRPEPYARWILGADFLPLLDGDEWGSRDARARVALALLQLARVCGQNGADGDRSVYDPLIAALGDTIPAGARRAWDLLAAPSTNLVPDRPAGQALAAILSEVGVRAHPLLDPTERLRALRQPVVLMHGEHDTIVPFTETLRLGSRLPPEVPRTVEVTRLFGHTKRSEAPPLRNPLVLAAEAARFVRVVRAILGAVDGR